MWFGVGVMVVWLDLKGVVPYGVLWLFKEDCDSVVKSLVVWLWCDAH